MRRVSFLNCARPSRKSLSLVASVLTLGIATLLAATWLGCASHTGTATVKRDVSRAGEQDSSLVSKGAAQDRERADEKRSTFAQRYEIAKRLISVGELREAASRLRKLRRTARNSLEKAMVAEGRASLYLARGELSRAESLASGGIKAFPSFAPAYRTRALIRKERKDLSGAIDDFRSALVLAPEDTQCLRGLAEIYVAQQRTVAALRALDRFLEVDSLDAWAQDTWCASMASLLGYSDFPLDYLRMLRSDTVTRGELAALLVVELELIGFTTPGLQAAEHGKRVPRISDCEGTWFDLFVEKLVGLGLLNVYPDRTFRPWDIVRKGPLAVELYYFLSQHCADAVAAAHGGESEPGSGIERNIDFQLTQAANYLDVDSSSYLWKPTTLMVQLGILAPDSDIVFGANRTLSGREARRVAGNLARFMNSHGCKRNE